MVWLQGMYTRSKSHKPELMTSSQGKDVELYKKNWNNFEFFFNSPTDRQRMVEMSASSTWPLRLVTCDLDNPPHYLDEVQPGTVVEYNRIPVQYTDIDLGAPGLETLLNIRMAQLSGQVDTEISSLRIRATLQFRKDVVYMITAPDKDTDPRFRHIAVALYYMDLTNYVEPPVRYNPIVPNIPSAGECQKLF